MKRPHTKPSVGTEISWPACRSKLLSWCEDSLSQFEKEHTRLPLRWFVLYSRPEQGFVWTCLCSTAKSEEYAKQWHTKNVSYRDKLLADPVWFDNSYYQIGSHQVSTHCDNPADFDFEAYTEISMPEWGQAKHCLLHPIPVEGETTPLMNHVAHTLWHVLHELIARKRFDALTRGPYFSVGICISDGPLLPLWVLNWPTHSQQLKRI
jgi:hypothetical protein